MTNVDTEFSKTLAQLQEQNPDLLNLMLEFWRWLEAFPGIYGSPYRRWGGYQRDNGRERGHARHRTPRAAAAAETRSRIGDLATYRNSVRRRVTNRPDSGLLTDHRHVTGLGFPVN